jgi:hypothetical protein
MCEASLLLLYSSCTSLLLEALPKDQTSIGNVRFSLAKMGYVLQYEFDSSIWEYETTIFAHEDTNHVPGRRRPPSLHASASDTAQENI